MSPSAYPRFRRARAHKFTTRTAGTITVAASQTWTAVDTALDITLAAQPGDTIEVILNGLFTSPAAGGGALRMDVACMSGAAVLSSFGLTTLVISTNTGVGVPSWASTSTETHSGRLGAPAWKVLSAGDLVAGQVTLRLFARNNNTTAVTIFADTDLPLRVQAKNLGPVDST